MSFARIVVLQDHRSTDQLYTYRIPPCFSEEAEIGKRVLIPFGRGNQAITGYIAEITGVPPAFATKEIVDVLDVEPVEIGRASCRERV